MAYNEVPTAYEAAPGWTAQYVNKYIKDNFAAGVPDILTTKGDLAAASAEDAAARVGVGANNSVLIASSAQAAGMRWGVDETVDALTAKGDLLVGTGADAVSPVGLPSSSLGYDATFFKGNLLIAASDEAEGVKWGHPWSAAKLTSTISMTNIANLGWTKITNFNYLEHSLGLDASAADDRYTAPTTGKYLVIAYLYTNDNANHDVDEGHFLGLYKNGSLSQVMDGTINTGARGTTTVPYILNGMSIISLTAGDYIELYLYKFTGAASTSSTVNPGTNRIAQYFCIEQLIA